MKTKKQRPYILLGPIITIGIMLVLYAVGGIYPFGDASTAISDGFAQYLPFLTQLKEKISNSGSLFFSWQLNGGINFWATIGYYLASPLSLIALFFPVEEMNNAFSLITLIKPFFMALTFSVFLKHTYNKNDLSLAIFSVLWAMSGFMTGGIYITSWYDGIIFLPLAIMGLHKLMNGESAWMYSLFLGLTIASNFYIGWITCLFCVIYFVYSFIADDSIVYEGAEKDAPKDETDEETINILSVFQNSYLLKTIFKFGFSSLLAGGISAVMTLPMAGALQNTGKGSITTETFTIGLSDVWGLLASIIIPMKTNYNSLTRMDCVYAFAGIATIVLVISYFFIKGVSVRKKIGNAFLIATMWISMIVNAVYFVWHGFGVPMGIMYRFAFIYSFILLKIAYEAFCEIKNIKWYGILSGAIFALICASAIYFNEMFHDEYFSPELMVKIIAFVIVYVALLFILSKKIKTKSIVTIVLLICIVAETIIFNFTNLNTLYIDENLSEKEVVAELTENIKDSERVHFESKKQTYKDMMMYGALFGYSSLEGYSSLADQNFGLSVTDLGTYGNRLNFQNGASEQTPVFNMFFPTKYYIDGKNRLRESFYRAKIEEKDGYVLYENNYTMPFMYTISTNIAEWRPFSYLLVMDNLNAATKYLTDSTENVVAYNKPVNFNFENCKYKSAYQLGQETDVPLTEDYFNFIEERMTGYAYSIIDMKKPMSISYDSVAETDGMMYLYVDTDELSELTVTLNGKTTEYYLFGTGADCTYELGEVKKGDVARITVGGHFLDDENGDLYLRDSNSFTATSFTVDMAKFENAYNKLDAMSDTEMLEFSDTYVKAKVTSYEDGLLYIPTSYDEGWTILIDGVETPLYEHESHILMAEITEGEHIVEMKYCPVGFVPGAIITGVSVAILVAWAIIATKRFKKEEECATISSNDVNEE